MFNYQKKTIGSGRITQFKIYDRDYLMTVEDVMSNLINDPEFRLFYNGILAKSSYDGFFWEHPSLRINQTDEAYEFVLVNSHSLNRLEPEPHVFESYFEEGKLVAVFPNLGKNAILVVPSPASEVKNYTHLALFVRNAPTEQIHAFWKKVAETYLQSLTEHKQWLSTAGQGVYWLHVRIDQRPKYYKYGKYKEPSKLR